MNRILIFNKLIYFKASETSQNLLRKTAGDSTRSDAFTHCIGVLHSLVFRRQFMDLLGLFISAIRQPERNIHILQRNPLHVFVLDLEHCLYRHWHCTCHGQSVLLRLLLHPFKNLMNVYLSNIYILSNNYQSI